MVEPGTPSSRSVPPRVARGYLGMQAGAGALWWVAVFASDDVRRATLGTWEPAWLVGPDLVLFVGTSAVAAVLSSRVAATAAAVWTTAITAALAVHGLLDRTAGWGVLAMSVASIGTVAAAATLWSGRLPVRWFFVGPFDFRVAGDRSPRAHLRRSLAQLVVFWTVFFAVVPLLLATLEQRLRVDWPVLQGPVWRWPGRAVFVAGSVVGLWSCVTMAVHGNGTPLPAESARDLVVAGPYRIVRNPMAMAGAAQTVGVGLWLGSWLVVAMAIVGAVAWNTFIRPVEEADLAARFGATYDAYRAAVRCWIPSLPAAATSGAPLAGRGS